MFVYIYYIIDIYLLIQYSYDIPITCNIAPTQRKKYIIGFLRNHNISNFHLRILLLSRTICLRGQHLQQRGCKA